MNVSSLTITGITFVGCGVHWTSPSQLQHLEHEVFAALLFVHGSDLTLINVTVSDAQSAGIYIYNVAGNVTVMSCEVSNAVTHTPDIMGGNVIVYDANLTASISISDSLLHSSGHDPNICRNNTKGYFFSNGLALYLGSSNLVVHIDNTKFYNNSGCNGGHMAILFFKFAPVSISNSSFNHGYANYGGGFYILLVNTFYDHQYANMTDAHTLTAVAISNSEFTNNFAELYGGAFYISRYQSLVLSGSVHMDIRNTIFKQNGLNASRNGGLAIYYRVYPNPTNDPAAVSKHHVTANLSHCNFTSHHTGNSPKTLHTVTSVIWIVNVPHLGINEVVIDSNNGSGIKSTASILVMYGSTTISNNHGLIGGGLLLCSESMLYFTPNSNIIINNNTARQTGGGIQVYSSNCLIGNPKCFYQFTKEVKSPNQVKLNVSGNKAEKGGDNIFGGSVDYCYFYLLWAKRAYKKSLRVPHNSIKQPSSVSSDPQKVCFNFSKEFKCIKNTTIFAYPGQSKEIFVQVVGQRNGAVAGVVAAYTTEEEAFIGQNEKTQTVGIHGKSITYTLYAPQNLTNRNITIKLNAGLHSDTSFEIIHHNPAEIHVFLKGCPFGFANDLTNSSASRYACKCGASPQIDNCSIQTGTITKKAKSWLGEFVMHNKTYLASARFCPLDYCNHSISDIKSNAHNLSQDVQCQYNRTGILCGSCPEGWSLVLGSSECHENCSNVWMLLLFPFALAGLLLVAIIHFLNLTVTMGTICGLIFYVNIIQDYSVTLLSTHPVPGLTPILQVFLSWLNLDVGISMCFYEGMNAFGKTMLLFIFPVYIWVLSAIIVFLSSRYISVTRLVGENAVKVLATLFLLSYSKMLRVTIGVLNFKEIKIYTSEAIISKFRWSADGNIPYFDPQKHLLLVMISMLVFMLLFPFTIFLMCIRHVHCLSNCSRLFSWVDKLKPFFDTYTGLFKDKARFWTGLLLFVRLFLLVVHTIDFHYDIVPYYFIIVVCLCLSTTMAVMGGVYTAKSLNAFEHFFLLNISLVFLFNTYIGDEGPWKSIPTHFLVSLAFLAFLGIVLYHAYLKFTCFSMAKHVPFLHHNEEMEPFSFKGIRDYDSTVQ